MKQHRACGFVAGVIIIAIMLVGCSAQDDGSQSTGATPTTTRITGYPLVLSVEAAVSQSVLAVEGTVTKVGVPTWNTADRKKPGKPAQGDALPAMIYTPFRVKVDKTYKGEVGSYLDVKAFGGTVGGETMVFEDQDYVPREGDRVVVFVEQVFVEKNGDQLAIPLSVYTVDGAELRNQYGGDNRPASLADLIRATQ